MNQMKYIVVNGNGPDEIYLFPNFIEHSKVAQMVIGISKRAVIGAGFVSIDELNPKPECFGESDSLGVQSRPEDTILLQQYIGWR